jgi:hypothetical protein
MRLGPWKIWGRWRDWAARESDAHIPNGDLKSFPVIRMVIKTGFDSDLDRLWGLRESETTYEICLEDTEYNIKTSYGKKIESIELAKFIADLKLIELGYDIEEPFYIGE